MHRRFPFTLTLALLWGTLWAWFLQCRPLGRYLAHRRTWLTVVIGVGVDLLIALLVVPVALWWQLLALVSASSLPIIVRSLSNERSADLEVIRDATHPQ